MNMPEILAPCGSPEAITAAIRCGTDAVYLGLKRFSARQNAANFDYSELCGAALLCRLHGVKIYVTVNTMLFDSELEEFSDAIRRSAESGADAFIVQDVGAADIIGKICPNIPIHASTQMTIHSVRGGV